MIDQVSSFLKQDASEKVSSQETVAKLKRMFR
jgi:flagellar biosynthesis/type III secretory pathway ATPase